LLRLRRHPSYLDKVAALARLAELAEGAGTGPFFFFMSIHGDNNLIFKYNRYRKKTQDGRELRRYCRRWKIERLFAWLHNFRRLVNRWEYHEANFLAMLQLGCLVILLRHL